MSNVKILVQDDVYQKIYTIPTTRVPHIGEQIDLGVRPPHTVTKVVHTTYFTPKDLQGFDALVSVK